MKTDWVEDTRRRAVAAQIKAAAVSAVVRTEREMITANLYPGEWGHAERSMIRRLDAQAAHAHVVARVEMESHRQALASEAAMPPKLREVS